MRLDFKTRLSLWHMAVVAVVLAVAAVAADRALARVVLGQIIDAAVLALAETEAASLQADPRAPVQVHEMAPGTGRPSFLRLDKFIQIIDLEGHVRARSTNLGTASLPVRPPVLARLRAGETVFETLSEFGEEPVRVVSQPVEVGSARYAVQVAMSLDDAHAVLRAGRWLFLVMGVAILVAVGLSGTFLARRALRPIDAIVRRAREIGEANLADRLPHPGIQDEVGRLVETLNAMLARIEEGFEVLRRFTGDAAHELRSPLSRLRAELEVTLRRPRDRAEYEEALGSCLEEVERLSQLTGQLLTLAHLDAGEGRESAGEAVALAPLVEQAVRRLEPEASRRGVAVVVQPSLDLFVSAAPGPASLALANILENALKFSPPGGEIVVGIARLDGEAVIAVQDGGPGIAAEEIPGIFERFHRGRHARSSDTAGFGLGLAISRAAVERQRGRITVDSQPGKGATFRIHLPMVA
jgi:two-component system, OmpR family, sensor kinase